MVFTGILLLVAVGLLVASLGTEPSSLAWGSVALSALAAVRILVRWRRRHDAAEREPGQDDRDTDDRDTTEPKPVMAPVQPDPVVASVDADQQADGGEDAAAEPGEEDTDAADLLVVYELSDEVLVVDEHPRYHLPRCRWPDHAHAERLPVREARELGFTPCDQCRPDTTLARRHRAAGAATAGS